MTSYAEFLSARTHEEVGEVARAMHDGDQEALAAELSQVAGIALAWGLVCP